MSSSDHQRNDTPPAAGQKTTPRNRAPSKPRKGPTGKLATWFRDIGKAAAALTGTPARKKGRLSTTPDTTPPGASATAPTGMGAITGAGAAPVTPTGAGPATGVTTANLTYHLDLIASADREELPEAVRACAEYYCTIVGALGAAEDRAKVWCEAARATTQRPRAPRGLAQAEATWPAADAEAGQRPGQRAPLRERCSH